MKYRKFKTDRIFTGHTFLAGEKVLITGETGVIADIIDLADAGDDIEECKGILSPGFVNCHCHLELSHLKGLVPKRTGLVEFIVTVVNERHMDHAFISAAIEHAENEMLQGGIVAVGDICNNNLTIPQKSAGRLRYHNFIEASGFIPSFAETRFNASKAILVNFQSAISAQPSTLSPHAPYSVSPELFALINTQTGNGLLTIHNQETGAENELFEKGGGELLGLYEKMKIDISFFRSGGKNSLQTWFPYFNRNQSIILVHNVTTSASDIEFIKHSTGSIPHPVFFCLCPNANEYISGMLPDVDMLVKHQAAIVLGTDSLASNHQLNIWEEIKTLQRQFPQIELAVMLQWATRNGALALQMDAELGSFEKGKRPGVVLIEGLDEKNNLQDSVSKRLL